MAACSRHSRWNTRQRERKKTSLSDIIKKRLKWPCYLKPHSFFEICHNHFDASLRSMLTLKVEKTQEKRKHTFGWHIRHIICHITPLRIKWNLNFFSQCDAIQNRESFVTMIGLRFSWKLLILLAEKRDVYLHSLFQSSMDMWY